MYVLNKEKKLVIFYEQLCKQRLLLVFWELVVVSVLQKKNGAAVFY